MLFGWSYDISTSTVDTHRVVDDKNNISYVRREFPDT